MKFIKNPSEKILKYAIEQNVQNIKYITNPSDEIKIFAIKKGLSISDIRKPTLEMIHEAMETNRIKIEKVINDSKINELKNLLTQISKDDWDKIIKR